MVIYINQPPAFPYIQSTSTKSPLEQLQAPTLHDYVYQELQFPQFVRRRRRLDYWVSLEALM